MKYVKLFFQFEWVQRKDSIIILIILLLGISVTALNHISRVNELNDRLVSEFKSDSDLVNNIIKNEVMSQIRISKTLAIVSGFYDNYVFEKEFTDQFNNLTTFFLDKHSNTVQAYSYIDYVNNTYRNKFEKDASNYWGSITGNITIKDVKGNINSVDDYYYPVTLINPVEINENAILLNLASNKKRKDALNLSEEKQTSVFTEGLKLVQETTETFAILSITPVVDKIGFISTALRIDPLINSSIVLGDTLENFSIELYDKIDGELYLLGGLVNKKFIYTPETDEKKFTSYNNINIGTRNWVIKTSTNKYISDNSILTSTILFSVLILTIIIGYSVTIFSMDL